MADAARTRFRREKVGEQFLVFCSGFQQVDEILATVRSARRGFQIGSGCRRMIDRGQFFYFKELIIELRIRDIDQGVHWIEEII